MLVLGSDIRNLLMGQSKTGDILLSGSKIIAKVRVSRSDIEATVKNKRKIRARLVRRIEIRATVVSQRERRATLLSQRQVRAGPPEVCFPLHS